MIPALIRRFHEAKENGDKEVIVWGSGKPMREFLYVDDMASLYSAVDYVVLPSHYEPFGLVVAESLESGTPVVVTASVGAAEILGEEDGVVIPDNHPLTFLKD